MNGKISAVVITILIGIIGYQSGILNNIFSKKSIECNSKNAINLGNKIIKDKLFPQIFSNYKYNINIILKKYLLIQF